MSFGEKPFALKNLQVAPLTGAGTYGTAVTLANGQKLVVKPNVVSSKLTGYYGATKAVATVVVDAEVTIDAGGYDRTALAAMTGFTSQSSGGTLTQDWDAADNLGYFGVIGEADDDDGGDTWIGLPKVKLSELPEWTLQGEDNLFLLTNLKGTAIADSNNLIVRSVAHSAAATGDFSTAFA